MKTDTLKSWFEKLVSCANDITCPDKETCTRALRGDIGPSGDANLAVRTTEADDYLCTLCGEKPLAVVHRIRLSEAQCIKASGGGIVRDGTHAGSPLLVYGPGRFAWASAAVLMLRIIGAWKSNDIFTKNVSRAPVQKNLSEIQAHIGLGALLGYPIADLHGLHKALCKPQLGLHCVDFYHDALAAFHALSDAISEHSGSLTAELLCYQWKRMRLHMRQIERGGA